MNTMEELIERLIAHGVLKNARIIEAFRAVARADFVPYAYRDEAYGDYPLPIGEEQTISQPTTVAFMLELLQPREGEKILDVGSGSGWTTALLAHIVGEGGSVWGVEIMPELVARGRKNLAKYHFPHARIEQAPDNPGLLREAPFDKILVSAATYEIPQALIDQLKSGGHMVIPVRESLWRIDKISEKELRKHEFPGFLFVPLK